MSDLHDAIVREPARGSSWDPMSLVVPGLDRLRAYLRGDLPAPPIQHLTGLTAVEAGVGTTTVSMPASEWFVGGHGAYLGGVFALPADVALAGAIISGLPPGVALTTQELSLHFLRGASPSSGNLIARGHIIHGGRSIGLSEVHIHDAAGRLLAYGSSRCVMLRVPVPPDARGWTPPKATADPEGWVPPIRRPVLATPTPREAFLERDGMALVRDWSDGTLPWPPMGYLFGLRCTAYAKGSASIEMPASGWVANAAGMVYGGVLALLADTGLDFAATTMLAPGTSYKTLDLKVNFLRPVPPDGKSLTARGQVFHSGKQMVVCTGDVVDAQGRQVVVATGTRMIVKAPFAE